MATVKLDPASLSEMRAFYQGELQTALSRLQHIQSVLEQLGDSSVSIAITASGYGSVSPAKTPRTANATVGRPRKRKGKPGPKSKWDKMILTILKSEDKPFTYDQLTEALLKQSGRPSSDRKKTKATVQNTIFKLRGTKKVMTFSKGSREKFIGLSEWFSDGKIGASYSGKVPSPRKAAPKKKGTGKRGRPAGSKNKSTAKKAVNATPARRRGRPRKAVAAAPVTKAPAKKAAVKKATPKKKAAPKKKTAPKKVASSKKKAAPKKTASPKKAAPKRKATKKTASKRGVKAAATAADTNATPAASPKAPAKKKAAAKKKAPKKATAKKAPAKKATAKKVKARKTPARGLSQAKAVQLPGDKTSE